MINFEAVSTIASEAGDTILNIYNRKTPIEITTKGDQSPLTEADLAADKVITEQLLNLDPKIPIVSEEGRVGDPLISTYCWLVDPLDGTKEFIKRNGMFTVNIALMCRDGMRWKPVFGVVHAPVSKTTWLGGVDIPSEKRLNGQSTSIFINQKTDNEVTRLVASGSHRGEKDESFAEAIGEHELIRMGSSLKACIVAEGSADLYPRFGPTSCWDIAAAHAVVTGAGGVVIGPEGTTLDYDLVENVLNPYFLVAADSRWNDLWVASQTS